MEEEGVSCVLTLKLIANYVTGSVIDTKAYTFPILVTKGLSW